MAATSFTDLLIHIFPGSDPQNPHRVDATISDGSFFHGHFSLDPQDLLQKQLEPEEYGRALCTSLFIGPIGQAHERAMSLAQSQSGGRLRVRFWIDEDVPRLQVLPWERLYHYHTESMRPLSLGNQTPFSRYIGLGIPEPHPLATDQLRILIAISNPSDLTHRNLSKIEVEKEVMALHEALGNLTQVQVTIMPGCSDLTAEAERHLGQCFSVKRGPTSLKEIRSLWTATDAPYHVFHFLGHGRFKSDEGMALLYLENDDGTAHVVKDRELVVAFQALNPRPALVFLAACESSTSDPGHSFTGLGPKLVHDADIPAVIAMQGKVEMELAKKLTGQFYRQLLRHGMVDLALNEARSSVFEPDQIAGGWDIPVLFMRLETGQLFAPDPIREALEAMKHDLTFSFFDTQDYLPLPIQVIHLTAAQRAHSRHWSEPEATAAVYLVSAVEEIFSQPFEPDSGRPMPRLIALIGDHGTNKSTQLKHIVWRTVQRSLGLCRPRVLPLYVDLRHFEPLAPGRPLEALILKSLGRFWPDLRGARPCELPGKPVLRIVFDGSENLTEQVRDQAWEQIADLMATEGYRCHQYMLSSDPEPFNLERFTAAGFDVHRLLIQPLSQQKIRHFLDHRPVQDVDAQACKELLKSLNESQLFDLVSVPAMMTRAVQRARHGDYPRSRVNVLQRWVGDAIGMIPAGQGMRLHAQDVLSGLAWQMQSACTTIWPVSLAFQTMAEIRGNREYSREGFFEELVRVGLLARVGDASLRFAYPPLQAYCCAVAIINMPHRDRVLRDVTSTFDRLARLRWWGETFVFLTGLMAHDPNALRKLLDRIVYGANLLEGEHVFLTARCLLECKQCQLLPDELGKIAANQPGAVSDAQDQVCQALRWRSDSANEPDLSYRILAIRSLGQLADPAMALDLGGIAYEKVRKNLRGESDYDFSSVRMAAAIALQRLESTKAREELTAIDTPLVELYEKWLGHDKEAINSSLAAIEADPGVRSLAALALGDLLSEDLLSEMEESSDSKEQVTMADTGRVYLTHLEDTFLDPDTPEPVRWAVTHALAMVNVPVVTAEFLDRVQQTVDRFDAEAARIQLCKCMAYLIGLTRSQMREAHRFLVGPCLRQHTDMRLWACAIEALGWLSNRSDRELLESIAASTFDGKPLDERFTDKAERDNLRRGAIEALRSIGDMETVHKLQRERYEEWLRDSHWPSELTRAFYRTCQEVYWRLDQEARPVKPVE